jgi:uncharacterized protein YndB with AHSA1/START domain
MEGTNMIARTTFSAEPGTHEVSLSRIFDAPRELVFGALTDAEAVPQWWGPRALITAVDRLEAKHAGGWRIVQHDAEGNEYAFRGVFHEVSAPERIIRTFEWEGMPGHVALETFAFEAIGEQTRLTWSSVFQTVQDRDGYLMAGAESGATESWERLAEHLASTGR